MRYGHKMEGSKYWLKFKKLDFGTVLKTIFIITFAVVFREVLGHYNSGIAPFVTLFPAVVISGVVCGTASAVVTALVSAAAADYLWVAPRDAFWPSDSAGWVNVSLFLAASGCVIWATRLLRVERDRVRTYFDVAGSVVVILGSDRFIDTINERGLKLFDFEHRRDIHRRFRIDDFLAPDDRPLFHKAFEEAIADRRHGRCETRLLGVGQSETIIRWRMVKTRDFRTRIRVIAVGYNVSDEIMAARALTRSEQRLRAVLHQVPAAIAILEAPAGKVLLRSDRSTEILGHSERHVDSVERLASYGGVHADGRPYKAEEYPIARALLFGETIEAEGLSYLRPDGRLVSLEVYAAPIRDPAPSGQIIASIGMAFDVSERKRTEKALQEALAARELLFREADHRIKNSLQMIAGLLQLQRNRTTNDELKEIFDDTIARVNSVAEVHAALQQCDDLQSVAFDSLLARICQRLASLNSAVEVRYSGAGNLLLDAERAVSLGLIATEILTNALRHAYPPGVSGVVAIEAEREHQSLVMSIADDGIGMPGEAARKGLGSTIIHALASQIGAEILVRSRPSKGTCFTIRLPKIGSLESAVDLEQSTNLDGGQPKPSHIIGSDSHPPRSADGFR